MPTWRTKAAIKLHTLIELRGSIPSFIHISDGKMHDVRVLDMLVSQGWVEAGAFYVMDRAYVDFARLYLIQRAGAFFVSRAKDNLQMQIVRRRQVNTMTGLRSDSHVRLTNKLSSQRYPDVLRRVVYFDEDSGKMLEFLTNNLNLPALTICALYKQRWQSLPPRRRGSSCSSNRSSSIRASSRFWAPPRMPSGHKSGAPFQPAAHRNRQEETPSRQLFARNPPCPGVKLVRANPYPQSAGKISEPQN